MAWNAVASLPANGRPLQPKRRGYALALLLLAPMVSGCETLERMDYFDRIFDPSLRSTPPGVTAMAPVRNPADPPAATNWTPQPAPVVTAMEPIWNPADNPVATARNPQPATTARAVEPRPTPAPLSAVDAESRTRSLVRQNPWLTRFWMELTPAQQARVERQLRRGTVRLASEQAGPAAVWDPMGLADRASLVFGGASPFERPEPTETRDRATLAGSS